MQFLDNFLNDFFKHPHTHTKSKKLQSFLVRCLLPQQLRPSLEICCAPNILNYDGEVTRVALFCLPRGENVWTKTTRIGSILNALRTLEIAVKRTQINYFCAQRTYSTQRIRHSEREEGKLHGRATVFESREIFEKTTSKPNRTNQ
jgi:hypothetical protein